MIAAAQAPERPWSRAECVVLAALVASGEPIAGLMFRLRRTDPSIRRRCALDGISLAAAPAQP